ncbi:MAG: enoyl-CoA hydratase-related protein [bacterium]|nr:enoyl-CoA hydratase-related protein [bacterium]
MQSIQLSLGQVTRLTLIKEKIHNAFNAEMIHEIHSAFSQISAYDKTRVVVLQATGRSFSAGADLNWMKRIIDYSEQENILDSRNLYEMLKAIQDCPVPTISRIQGSALGGGCGLIAATDMAFGIQNAKFGFTEVKLGLVPAVISPFVRDKIGLNHCRRFFLTGERFDSQTALEIGLLNKIVKSEVELDQTIDAICNEIINSSPDAVKKCKTLIHGISNQSVEESREFVCKNIAEARISQQGQDGLKGFLNKKPMDWSRC